MNRKFLIVALSVSLFLAGVVSYFASSSPDGLEKVATDIGFIDTATDHAVSGGPLAGYSFAGIENAALAGGIAGVLGVLATGAVGFLAFKLIAGKKSQ